MDSQPSIDQAAASIERASEAIRLAAQEFRNAATLPAVQPSSLGWFWVYLSLAAIAIGLALVAVVCAIKYRRKPLMQVGSLTSGGALSGVLSAAGSKIIGLSFPMTGAEAAFYTMFWFVVGTILWLVVAVCFAHFKIVRPLVNRYNAVHGVRVWVELWSGVEPLRVWIADALRHTQADPMWDEFACALLAVQRELDGVVEGIRMQQQALIVLGGEAKRNPNGESAIKLLTDTLSPPIRCLTSALTHTTLNFTVWRVSDDGRCLEHLLSLPVEPGHEAGYGKKDSLKIWTDDSKSRSGSLASDAMLSRKYRVLKSSADCGVWDRRNLGRHYDSSGAMPVPCDGGHESPWAVICVESRDGLLPLESHAVRQLAGHLARTLHETAWLLRRMTIDETRGTNPQSDSGLSATGNVSKKSVVSPVQTTVTNANLTPPKGANNPAAKAPQQGGVE